MHHTDSVVSDIETNFNEGLEFNEEKDEINIIFSRTDKCIINDDNMDEKDEQFVDSHSHVSSDDPEKRIDEEEEKYNIDEIRDEVDEALSLLLDEAIEEQEREHKFDKNISVHMISSQNEENADSCLIDDKIIIDDCELQTSPLHNELSDVHQNFSLSENISVTTGACPEFENEDILETKNIQLFPDSNEQLLFTESETKQLESISDLIYVQPTAPEIEIMDMNFIADKINVEDNKSIEQSKTVEDNIKGVEPLKTVEDNINNVELLKTVEDDMKNVELLKCTDDNSEKILLKTVEEDIKIIAPLKEDIHQMITKDIYLLNNNNDIILEAKKHSEINHSNNIDKSSNEHISLKDNVQNLKTEDINKKIDININREQSNSTEESTNSDKENQYIDENQVVLRNKSKVSATDKSEKKTPNGVASRGATTRPKTLKRTRKFVIDGVVVTTTTSKIIYGDEDKLIKDAHFLRKQELRELKMLQKQETKQYQDLAAKAQYAREQQEKRFEQEMIIMTRSYDNDLEILNRQQKQQVERSEQQQEIDLKLASKRIRTEQERDLKQFKESLKNELKLLKQEMELIPKDKRKEVFRLRKEKMDLDHGEKEKMFIESLNDKHEQSMKRLGDSHCEKIALLERQFLQQKQQLLRAREAAVWELEEHHLHEKHQLAKRQLKDIFFLQRHQMLIRHEKELEHVKRMNNRKEEDLLKWQSIERRQLPKRIRSEMKTRELMFKESLRISMANITESPEAERERLKKFQEGEKKRYKAEQQRHDIKYKRQLDDLRNASDATIKELEQLQNEKRKMLMEHETMKLKQLDDEHTSELQEWKVKLKPRKQKLEEEFARQQEEQEKFYNTSTVLNNYTENYSLNTPSTPGSEASFAPAL